jgi:natural product biosynthesis luciferase-like monooxygenase protein
VDFGVFALPTYYAERQGAQGEFMRWFVDFIASAEDYGFDSLWANEHHFHPYGGLIPSPAVMLSALAQRTRRVRLGTSVVVLPLHNPVEVAEQLAMVDVMSGGRVDLGIGRGFVVFDYQVWGLPIDQGRERTEESLEVILKAWSGAPFTHHGTHFHYENVEVWPHPEQRPHPPIWVAATGTPASFESAAQHGYNMLCVSSLRPMEDLAKLTHLYVDSWRAAGRGEGGFKLVTHFQVVVSRDRNEAKELIEFGLREYFRLHGEAVDLAKPVPNAPPRYSPMDSYDTDRWIDEGRIIVGTPDDCIQQLERARDVLGVTGVDGTFHFGGFPRDKAEESLRLFGTEVIPALKASRPAVSAAR